MKKLSLSFLLLCITAININAQLLQSPEQFLGYSIGTKFTRHHKIVEYFKIVAQSKPDMVKIEKYGETNEGRELMLAYIALPENLKRLDEIRKNNLRLTGILNDDTKAIANNIPAIVWLSYNVHGNEASSSEAAMQTLFALVDPNNQQTKEWLKNTIVIIDPCINPDGRDRYINWFNSVVGKNFDTNPQSREHREPWPGGRSNHYNFDLNRDWAWQTQIETVQRLKKYNEWMPQIHVDFHEQGINEPYYFAPAAEPFHEVITPWQREFQITIGKNNAKYFDEKGWLYFTKERFDLFYPSYGDTYPIYNGAIGMTYEQGGGPAGGLASINEDGDTLKLTDRVLHHYTTGLSTVEIASKNAQRVIDEFKKFFDDNRNAKNSEYKMYVINRNNDENKINAVLDLLKKNRILYKFIDGKIKGYNYFTNKEEEIDLPKYSIAISAYQPKSTLLKVLFEPQSKLADSATYDITAWSIPYAYGLQTYAMKEKKEFSSDSEYYKELKIEYNNYGYLIPYTSLNSAKALAYLLKNNVKVRVASKPFVYNKKSYERGTLILLKTSNSKIDLDKVINFVVANFKIETNPVSTGFVDKGADFGSPDVHSISAPKVALITGETVASTDAGEVWNLFDAALDYPITLINALDLQRVNLKNFTVVILPDGNYRNLNDKVIVDKLKDFVRSGGKLIALQNAVAQLSAGDWGIKMKADKEEDKGEYGALKKFGDKDREFLPNSIPGAIYKVELDNTHPLAYGYPNFYYTLKQDANIYEFMKEGWNVGILKKESYTAGFSGYKVKNKLKNGLLFGVEEMGSGSVVFMADNPLFRLFWENGKLLFCNAVFLVGQ